MTKFDVDVEVRAEKAAAAARVEALHSLSPTEKVVMVRRVFARLQELRGDLPWLHGFFEDLYCDTRLVCGRDSCEDCREEGAGVCSEADQIEDELSGDLSCLAGLFDMHERRLADLLDRALEVVDGFVGELERRLRSAPRRPSPTAQRWRARPRPGRRVVVTPTT